MDYSLPGPSIHGIFQAKVLEWGAIAFSTDDARGWQCPFVLFRLLLMQILLPFAAAAGAAKSPILLPGHTILEELFLSTVCGLPVC